MMAGELSLWYIGTSTLRDPIPSPLTRRPIANWYHAVVEVISMTMPMQQKNAEQEIPIRRPSESASFPAIKLPNKLPTQTSATIVPCRAGENMYVPSACSAPNRLAKSSMRKKPEICPETYPNMNPPIDATAPRKHARNVTFCREAGMTVPGFASAARGEDFFSSSAA